MEAMIFAGLTHHSQDQFVNRPIVCEFEKVIQSVCYYYNITPIQLRSKSRVASIMEPRKVAMYLAYMHSGRTLVQIASYFSKDHSTVIHARESIQDLMSYDRDLKKKVLAIKQSITSKQAA